MDYIDTWLEAHKFLLNLKIGDIIQLPNLNG